MAAGMVAQGAAVLTIVLDNIYPEPAAYHHEYPRVQPDAGRTVARAVCWPLWRYGRTFAVHQSSANAPRTPRYFFSMALCSYLSWALGSWLGAIATGLLPPLITAALGISLVALASIGLPMPACTATAAWPRWLCDRRSATPCCATWCWIPKPVDDPFHAGMRGWGHFL